MKPSASEGARVGAALTTALAAIAYLGWKVFGLPFAPFDLFDLITRALPGVIVTMAIDSMVRVSQTLHVTSTGSAGKIAEHAMAVGLFVLGGTVAAAVAFAALRASNEAALLFGAVLGAMSGVGALVVANRLDRIAPGDQLVSGSWLVVGFLLWGLALGWANDRLSSNVARDRPLDVARDRREFLWRFSGWLAALTFIGTIGGVLAGALRRTVAATRWSDANALPNADSRVRAVPGTRAEFTALPDHYRVDAVTRPPVIDERRWRLQVGGLVDAPLAFTLDDLRALEPLNQFITLSCISNPIGGDLIGTTRWSGVSLQRVLSRVGPSLRATHLKITSADGFWEVVALETIRADTRVMLAYAWDGVALPVEHGFPLRLYVPDVYGMKQPKWIVAIDAVDHWEAGYWVSRGWDRDGRILATSAIDAVVVRPADATKAGGGAAITATVGGIAHAGVRGISKVEVQVDGGEWHEAQLRDPLSGTTWVIWRSDVTLPSTGDGAHLIRVRCYDGAGSLQNGELHSRRVQRG